MPVAACGSERELENRWPLVPFGQITPSGDRLDRSASARPPAVLEARIEFNREPVFHFDVFYSWKPTDGHLRLPVLREKQPSRQDNLWEETCFEAFVRPKGGSRYWEFNFSPNGDWNVYALSSYRKNLEPERRVRDVRLLPVENQIGTQTFGYSVELANVTELESTYSRQGLEVGLTAVLQLLSPSQAVQEDRREGRQAFTKTYWALAHVADRPDFHRPESFVLQFSENYSGKDSEK